MDELQLSRRGNVLHLALCRFFPTFNVPVTFFSSPRPSFVRRLLPYLLLLISMDNGYVTSDYSGQVRGFL
ncbi:hypothetical protein QYF36_004063 [Acer negundo]|nr:hypothetical protein QYF36_004063 [Acer negundo]